MRREVGIAFAIAAAFAILLGGVVQLATRGGDKTYNVTAYFPRAIGLFPRSTVRVLGVEVGRVATVSPEGDRVRVQMNIRDGVKIPRDASAIIVPISLISDRYVQLAPVWRGGPKLRNGDRIPLERGIAPAELDDLLATLKKFIQALEPGTATAPGALGQFIQNADKALAGQGPALGETIDGLTTLLDSLGSNVSSVDAIIVNLDRLLAELSRHDAAIQQTNRGLASVFGALATQQQSLAAGPGHLAGLVRELASLIRAHRSDLEADLDTLAKTSAMLVRQKDRLLEQILWLPVLSKGANGAFDTEFKRIRVRDWPTSAGGVKP
jgi:phospholipid/cholesterol/gamma-HCH transport system substrate-binding protein